MFRLLLQYGLKFGAEPGEHLWTFVVSGLDENGEFQTEQYVVQADEGEAAQAEALKAVQAFINTCRPKPI